MTDPIRVFVNAGPVDVPAGARVADAIRAIDPTLLEKVMSGAAYVTDGRGIAIDPAAPLAGGSILRVAVRAGVRSGDADA